MFAACQRHKRIMKYRWYTKYFLVVNLGVILFIPIVFITTMYGGSPTGGLSSNDQKEALYESTHVQAVTVPDPKRQLYERRRRTVQDVCTRNGVPLEAKNDINPNKFHYMYVDDKYKLLYCMIPKVACTNWKRVLLVLSGKVNTTNPMKLTPAQAHSEQLSKHLKKLDSYTPEEIKYRLKHYFKFMFVREPLERLLSAYRNKFTVTYNDYFNQRYGRQIIKKYRVDASKEAIKKGRGVKFEEFVRYVLDPETPRPFNAHWRQYYKICHPCLMNYDVIGKYETMDDDVDYVLQEVGVDHLIKFPRANLIKGRPRTWEVLSQAYQNISLESVHKLWELYSVDYAMFNFPYPDFTKSLPHH